MDGLIDFIRWIRSDQTRKIIRFIAVMLIAVQISEIWGHSTPNIIPLWLMEIFDVLLFPPILFFSLTILVLVASVIGVIRGLHSEKSPYRYSAVKSLENLIATIISVVIIFNNEIIARTIGALGLILFLVFDIYNDFNKKDSN